MRRASGEEPSDLIRSVSRALRILEEVGSSCEGLEAKEIARRCGLKPSTTHHLLRTLCYEGYLVRLRPGRYIVGLEITDRFRNLSAALASPPPAGSVLRHLVAMTGHSAYLARFVDGRIAITEVVEGPYSPHLEDLIPGFDEAAHATALGKALLSTLEPEARRAYLRAQGMCPYTARTLTDPIGLEAELVGTGPHTTFVEETQYRPGVSCAARLVRARNPADAWWSVAVSVEARRFREPATFRSLVGHLKDAARDVSQPRPMSQRAG